MNWTDASEPHQTKLMGAGSRTIENAEPVLCPICHRENIRFYYHLWDISKRGTVWVWCERCHEWTHISHLREPLDYEDPFAGKDEEVGRLEDKGIIEELNQMWEKNEIPHAFAIK